MSGFKKKKKKRYRESINDISRAPIQQNRLDGDNHVCPRDCVMLCSADDISLSGRCGAQLCYYDVINEVS